jgi:hypothetical protein
MINLTAINVTASEFGLDPTEDQQQRLLVGIAALGATLLSAVCLHVVLRMCSSDRVQYIRRIVTSCATSSLVIFSIVFSMQHRDESTRAPLVSPKVFLLHCGFEAQELPQYTSFRSSMALVVTIIFTSLILPEIVKARLLDDDKERTRGESHMPGASLNALLRAAKRKAGPLGAAVVVIGGKHAGSKGRLASKNTKTCNDAERYEIRLDNGRTGSVLGADLIVNTSGKVQSSATRTLLENTKSLIPIVANNENLHEVMSNLKRCPITNAHDRKWLKRAQLMFSLHQIANSMIPLLTSEIQCIALGFGLKAFFWRGLKSHDTNCWFIYIASITYFQPVLLPWCKVLIAVFKSMASGIVKWWRNSLERTVSESLERTTEKEEAQHKKRVLQAQKSSSRRGLFSKKSSAAPGSRRGMFSKKSSAIDAPTTEPEPSPTPPLERITETRVANFDKREVPEVPEVDDVFVLGSVQTYEPSDPLSERRTKRASTLAQVKHITCICMDRL